MQLPQKIPYEQLLTKWAAILNPIIANPTTNPTLLQNVKLASGANSIPHKLGQPLQGWIITRMRNVAVSIYDTQDSNQMPQLTLNLTSSGACVVDLLVF